MNKSFVKILVLLATIGTFSGCDSGTQTQQVNDIGEVVWKADGTGFYGFLQRYSYDPTTTYPSQPAYSIARFNADGSLAETYSTGPKSYTDFAQSLFVASDNSSCVTQLDNDLYRFTFATGQLLKLDSLYHLIVVSPDLHYAVWSPSPAVQPTKTVQVLDITRTPVRIVAQFDVNSLDNTCGVWLSGGTFAITAADSVGDHISIYDTTGTLRTTIPGAQTQFHNFAYSASRNELYFRNSNHNLASVVQNYSVDRINLTTMARRNIQPLKTENFDITKDGNVIVYSTYDSTGSLKFRSRDLTTLKESVVASDLLRIISLSPTDDRLAYISGDVNVNSIRVIPFNRP